MTVTHSVTCAYFLEAKPEGLFILYTDPCVCVCVCMLKGIKIQVFVRYLEEQKVVIFPDEVCLSQAKEKVKQLTTQEVLIITVHSFNLLFRKLNICIL